MLLVDSTESSHEAGLTCMSLIFLLGFKSFDIVEEWIADVTELEGFPLDWVPEREKA